MTKLTFIIPCYGSALTLPAVVDELKQVLTEHKQEDYQLILINDGSPDGLWQIIEALAAADSRVLGLNLARNFGQGKARLAALPYISSPIAVYLDDDGQHPADKVFELITKVEQGADLVFARFIHKRHHILRRLASAANGRLLEITGAKPRGIYLSSFFAISSLVISQLQQYHSPFPSFTSYIMQCTDKLANVNMPHRPRKAGKSGYNFSKLLAQWLTGFTNFSIVPLRIISALGAITAATGLIYACFLVLRKLWGAALLPGYTSLMAALLILGGLLLLSLGLLGEYIGRIYMTLSHMPSYVIRNTTKEEQMP